MTHRQNSFGFQTRVSSKSSWAGRGAEAVQEKVEVKSGLRSRKPWEGLRRDG